MFEIVGILKEVYDADKNGNAIYNYKLRIQGDDVRGQLVLSQEEYDRLKISFGKKLQLSLV